MRRSGPADAPVGVEDGLKVLSATERRLPVLPGSSSGHRASISSSRATGRPRRAARILRRSRAFFDFHASGGMGLPCRRTRKPPSVWSVSGAGPSEPAAINTPAARPAVSRKPSFRSSRSIRSASSLAPRGARGRARPGRPRPVRRARAVAQALPRAGRRPASPSRMRAIRVTPRRTGVPHDASRLPPPPRRALLRVRALLAAGRPSRPRAGARDARSPPARALRPRARRLVGVVAGKHLRASASEGDRPHSDREDRHCPAPPGRRCGRARHRPARCRSRPGRRGPTPSVLPASSSRAAASASSAAPSSNRPSAGE